MTNQIQVGITGGIGSGKSTIARLFSVLGVAVYDADSRAKHLMIESEVVKNEIIRIFGHQAYLKSGDLNTKHIASIAFKNKRKLSQLNAAVHPAVSLDYKIWAEQHVECSILLKEAALLIETGSYKELDKLIVVTAPKEIRIDRVIKRDNTNIEKVKSRINNQMTDDGRLEFADYVICNDGSQLIISQVWSIYQDLMQRH